MANLSEFCTCTDTKCPYHPSNHDKGCSLCIAKNLKLREIPNCFYDSLGPHPKLKSYFYEDFARLVLEKEQQEQPRGTQDKER